MSVMSEKAAEGLSRWEPSKNHDDLRLTTLPCMYVCVFVFSEYMMCLGCAREATKNHTLAHRGNE